MRRDKVRGRKTHSKRMRETERWYAYTCLYRCVWVWVCVNACTSTVPLLPRERRGRWGWLVFVVPPSRGCCCHERHSDVTLVEETLRSIRRLCRESFELAPFFLAATFFSHGRKRLLADRWSDDPKGTRSSPLVDSHSWLLASFPRFGSVVERTRSSCPWRAKRRIGGARDWTRVVRVERRAWTSSRSRRMDSPR